MRKTVKPDWGIVSEILTSIDCFKKGGISSDEARGLFTPAKSPLKILVSQMVAHFITFSEEKITYDLADFHYQWFSDAARMIQGERVYRHCESFKETGKTTIHNDITCFLLKSGAKKHIRFTHSSDDIRKEWNDSVYNHMLDPLVRRIWGTLVGEVKVKEEGKRRFTGSVLQLKNGTISRTSTGMQIGTGTTDLHKGHRIDLQILDDTANILTAESEVIAAKQKKRIDELISGMDNATGSCLSFCNPQARNKLTDEIRADAKFDQQRIYLYMGGKLQWAYTPGNFGKYVETEEEVKEFIKKYPDRKPVVSVEYEKSLSDYEVTMLGMSVSQDMLFFKTDQTSKDHEQEHHFGATLRVFEAPKKKHVYSISTDHSRAVGRNPQALVVRDYTDDTIAASLRDNRLQTRDFCVIAEMLHTRYNSAMFCFENDGASGLLYLELLRQNHGVKEKHIYSTVTLDTKTKKRSRRFGYIPSLTANRRIYNRMQEVIDTIALNCPDLLEEIGSFTWEDQDDNKTYTLGHFDLIRALCISEECRTEALKRSQGVPSMVALNQ